MQASAFDAGLMSSFQQAAVATPLASCPLHLVWSMFSGGGVAICLSYWNHLQGGWCTMREIEEHACNMQHSHCDVFIMHVCSIQICPSAQQLIVQQELLSFIVHTLKFACHKRHCACHDAHVLEGLAPLHAS